MKKESKGITLVTLVITIIILLILAGVAITALTQNGLLKNAEKAKSETTRSQATETINLKITDIQIDSYAEKKQLPNLQYLADKLCEDDDMEYVLKTSKKSASLEKINVSGVSSIYTKLKKYPYEFEINSSLQLASIDGIEVSKDDNNMLKFSTDLENWIKTLGDVTITVEDITTNNLLQKLMENKNSVDYMFSNNNIFEAVLNSPNAMEMLGKSKYAGYIAITNENYREKVLSSSYVDYFDKGAIAIPTLSDNKNVIYSSVDSGYKGYYAFDKENSTAWYSHDTQSEEYIGYDFGYNVIPYKIGIVNISHSGFYRCKDFYIQGAGDDNTFSNLTKILIAKENNNIQKFNIENVQECRIIKMVIKSKYAKESGYSNGIAELQVYCREIPSN